jgi:hypothetical protein
MDFTDKQKDVLRRLGPALSEAINDLAVVGRIFSEAVDAGLDILALHLNATVNLRRAAPEEIRIDPEPPKVDTLHCGAQLGRKSPKLIQSRRHHVPDSSHKNQD